MHARPFSFLTCADCDANHGRYSWKRDQHHVAHAEPQDVARHARPPVKLLRLQERMHFDVNAV